MSPKKVNKELKRQQILMAAIKVFAEKGLKSSRMADIASQAGVGKGTIYEYFRSRDEIFIEACNLLIIEMMAKFRQIAESSKPPAAKLKELIVVSLDISGQFSPEMSAFVADFWAEGIRSNTQDNGGLIDIKPLYEEARRYYQRALQEGIDSGDFRQIDTSKLAAAMIGVIDGLQIQWVLDSSVFDLKEIALSLIDLFMNGIKK